MSLFFSVLLATTLQTAGAAELGLEPDVLVAGQPVTVTSPELAGGQLAITYRPGTVIDHSETIALDPTGQATWTPRYPGLASLIATAGEQKAESQVSVRYPRTPGSGILVFLLASSLLFGSAAFGMRQLFRGAEEEGLEVPQGPLDT